MCSAMLLTLIHLDDPLPPLGFVCRLTAIDVIAFIHDWYSADRIPFSFDVSPLRCVSVDGLVVVYLFKKKSCLKKVCFMLFLALSRLFTMIKVYLTCSWMKDRAHDVKERGWREMGGSEVLCSTCVSAHWCLAHAQTSSDKSHEVEIYSMTDDESIW